MGLDVHIRKQIGRFSIDVSFFCPEGKTLALIGPSGSGKTTIVRMLAGLETPDEGRIVSHDTVLFDSALRICLPPQKRCAGFVFQDYTLFPHLTIHGNAAFAAKDGEEVRELLHYFGLWALRNRRPHQISGGERQRCAVCQALARHPHVLLLDEPFSALDVVTRRILREELKKIKDEKSLSVIYVTHDITEALFMGDVIVPIVKGRVDKGWLDTIVSRLTTDGDQMKATREPKLALAY